MISYADIAEARRRIEGVARRTPVLRSRQFDEDCQATVFFKEAGDNDWRISMRSKGEVDVNAIAQQFGGGGHKNASGCSARGSFAELKPLFENKLLQAIDGAGSRQRAAGRASS